MKTLAKLAKFTAMILLAALFLGGTDARRQNPATPRIMQYEWKNLDVNAINCTIASDGPYADYRATNSAGLEWPIGSGKTAAYSAGLWIIGVHHPSGQLRSAVMNYQTEYQPGPLLETFNTTANDDSLPVSRAADSRYRLYKIIAGDTLSPDYIQWPGDLGAPFIDVNGNGVWDPGIDRPKFYGDEQLWCVVNDANKLDHKAVGTTAPMGLEVQTLYYAFHKPGAAANIMFMRWKIINKSDADYDSVYLGEWSDVDLGDANDDVPGCDTTLQLGYVYNGDNNDAIYGVAPPADGFVFLEGPKVPGSPGDSALVDGKYYKGFRNLRQSGFVAYLNDDIFSDPPMGDAQYPFIAYAFLQGKEGWTNQVQISPTTGMPTTFWLSGDPVAGTGDLPATFAGGRFSAPQDIRIMNNCGPFTLAKGDTQEIVGAFVIAQGSSNLNSITSLKQTIPTVRQLFLSGGQPPERFLFVSPTRWDFGSKELGNPRDTATITLTNAGMLPVTISSISPPSLPFSILGSISTPFNLTPQDSADIRIIFGPDSAGNYVDSVVILTNDSVFSKFNVPLRGYSFTVAPAVPGKLYAMSYDGLLTVDTSSGAATSLGSLMTDVLTIRVHPSSHKIYELSQESQLSTVSTSPVAAYLLYALGLDTVRSMAFRGDTLYVSANKALFRVDLTTGTTTPVVTVGLDMLAIDFNPVTGELWAIVRSQQGAAWRLYKVGLPSGETSSVVITGINGGIKDIQFDGKGNLFGILDVTAPWWNAGCYLIRITTFTGPARVVGKMGQPDVQSLAFRRDSVVLGVRNENVRAIPSNFALEQNYPNPFNPTSEIRFQITEIRHVRLVVYDLLGREVATLVNEVKQPGTYTVEFSGSNLASGVYFYQLKAGTFVQTRKLLLLR